MKPDFLGFALSACPRGNFWGGEGEGEREGAILAVSLLRYRVLDAYMYVCIYSTKGKCNVISHKPQKIFSELLAWQYGNNNAMLEERNPKAFLHLCLCLSYFFLFHPRHIWRNRIMYRATCSSPFLLLTREKIPGPDL